MEPTHEIQVTYKVTVPHELADVMDSVENDVDEWLSNVDPIQSYDEDDELHEVRIEHLSTAWKSL